MDGLLLPCYCSTAAVLNCATATATVYCSALQLLLSRERHKEAQRSYHDHIMVDGWWSFHGNSDSGVLNIQYGVIRPVGSLFSRDRNHTASEYLSIFMPSCL